MFTRSCSEVKVRAVAVLTCNLDLRNSQAIDSAPLRALKEKRP
jgi:hypothetical protein